MSVLIEGFSPEELLMLNREEREALLITNKPVVFRAGSAEILAEFQRNAEELIVDLAHIDGGGEGVLPTITRLITSYAECNGYSSIQWRVHATNCADPNPKLQRVLERTGPL